MPKQTGEYDVSSLKKTMMLVELQFPPFLVPPHFSNDSMTQEAHLLMLTVNPCLLLKSLTAPKNISSLDCQNPQMRCSNLHVFGISTFRHVAEISEIPKHLQ
jgi:hypothetical protein